MYPSSDFMIKDNDPGVPIQLPEGENGVTLVQSTKWVRLQAWEP